MDDQVQSESHSCTSCKVILDVNEVELVTSGFKCYMMITFWRIQISTLVMLNLPCGCQSQLFQYTNLEYEIN